MRPGKMFCWIWQFLISLFWRDRIGPVLKALTECEVSSNAISELDEADLRKLFKGGYRTAPLLKAADESGLIRSGMSPAKISFLMRAISGGGASVTFMGVDHAPPCSLFKASPCIHDPGPVWSPTPDSLLEAPDRSREDMFSRVSRLKEGGTTIGTCCRLADGIILTARHNISPRDVVRYC